MMHFGLTKTQTARRVPQTLGRQRQYLSRRYPSLTTAKSGRLTLRKSSNDGMAGGNKWTNQCMAT
jgi:hypothetical protein